MSVAKEAWAFFLPVAVAAAVAGVLGYPLWMALGGLLAIGILAFFRDPRRQFDGPEEVVIAAADGLVTRVDTVEEPIVGSGPLRRVVTFLSVFDVHVQRCPVEGEVVASQFASGRKVAAFRENADLVNENHLIVLRRSEGEAVGVRQIAGLVARRVVPYLDRFDRVARGDHLGVIRFGSRVDLLLPASYEVLVSVGDRLRAGETPVAMPTDPSSPPPEDAAELSNP